MAISQAMGREVNALGNIPLSANPCHPLVWHSGSRRVVSVYPGSAISGRTRLASFNPSSVEIGRHFCPGYSIGPTRPVRRSEIRFPGKVPALRIQPLTGGCRNRERHMWLDFAVMGRISSDNDLATTLASWLGTAVTDLAFGAGGANLRSLSFTKNNGVLQ
jgi:hypothetical protein